MQIKLILKFVPYCIIARITNKGNTQTKKSCSFRKKISVTFLAVPLIYMTEHNISGFENCSSRPGGTEDLSFLKTILRGVLISAEGKSRSD